MAQPTSTIGESMPFEAFLDLRVRIPDVMVLRQAPSGPLVTDTPLVVVEVLSSNRSDDLVRKSHEYLQAGVRQYWVVDPRDEVLDVLGNDDGWAPLLHLTRAHPRGSVTAPVLGALDLDVRQVMA